VEWANLREKNRIAYTISDTGVSWYEHNCERASDWLFAESTYFAISVSATFHGRYDNWQALEASP